METNTAITNGIQLINSEIQLFNDQFQRINQIIDTINLKLLSAQIPLILNRVLLDDLKLLNDNSINELGTFSDLIIQRGKDILLLADQANQFICVSNDAFDRVIDTWNWLTSRDMNNNIILLTNQLRDEVFLLKDTINNRIDMIQDIDLLSTQDLLDTSVLKMKEILDTIISTLSNSILIYKKSYNITNIFKNVLAVNTTVGIALAVTQRSWDIMKRMNKHNYSTITTTLPEDVVSSTSAKLSTNILYPISMIEREKQVHSWMTKILISPGLDANIRVNNKIFKFINKRDTTYSQEDLPSNYNTLSTPQILESYTSSKIVPDIINNIISNVALIQTIGEITHQMLIDWYSTQINPLYSITELILESEDPKFVEFHNKYLNEQAIQEYQKIVLKKKQQLQMRDILLEKEIISPYPIEEKIKNLSVYNFEGFELLQGTMQQIAFQQFLNHKIEILINSEQHLLKIDDIKNRYINKLVPETNSGQFTLAEYDIIDGKETLVQVIEQFKYSYYLYKDDLKIYYLEAKINKLDYFLIKNGTMQTNYTFTEDLPKTLTYVNSSIHNVELLQNYKSYLVNDDYIQPEYNIIDMNIIVQGEEEDKLNSIKKVRETTYKNSIDNKGLNIITKTTNGSDIETHWVTNNLIERVTTDITNIYRTELIKGNMDFAQARINSIISTLRFLGYREELDAYIDDTWLYGVPRYVAQP